MLHLFICKIKITVIVKYLLNNAEMFFYNKHDVIQYDDFQ